MSGPIAQAAFAAAQKSADAARSARQAAWLNRAPIAQVAMATPPTITTGGTSAMTSPQYHPANGGNSFINLASAQSDRIAFSRGALKATSGNAEGAAADNVTQTNAPAYGGSGSSQLSFIHDGAAFELVTYNVATSWIMVRIDDQYVTMTPQATAGAANRFYAKYDFGADIRPRRVDVIQGGNGGFIGVNVAPGDGLWRAPIRGPRAIVLADSFGGSSGSAGTRSFTSVLADLMGWDDLWSSGVGGTGYLATNGGNSPTFRGRVQHDVIQYAPDAVIVAGSVNDFGQTADALGTEANLLFAQLRAALPNALLIAGGHTKKGVNTLTASTLDGFDAIRAAAAANGVVYMSPVEMPLVTGAGTVQAGTLNAGYAAGATGNVVLTGASAPTAATIEIGTGAARERIELKAHTAGGGPTWTYSFNGAMQYAHAAGTPWKQVGSCYLTGNGQVGTTTGWGTADRYTTTDGTHPTDAGAAALARAWAGLLRGYGKTLAARS